MLLNNNTRGHSVNPTSLQKRHTCFGNTTVKPQKNVNTKKTGHPARYNSKNTKKPRNVAEVSITINDASFSDSKDDYLDVPMPTDSRKYSISMFRDSIPVDHEMEYQRSASLVPSFKPSSQTRKSDLLPNKLSMVKAKAFVSTPNDSPSNKLNRRSRSSFMCDSFQNEEANEYRFSCGLSKIGQCAMIKSYEDEIYNKLKMKFPKTYFPRVRTPLFNLNTNPQACSSSLSYTASNTLLSLSPSCTSINSFQDCKSNTPLVVSPWDILKHENENISKYSITKQIEDAMEILDDLSKIKPETIEESVQPITVKLVKMGRCPSFIDNNAATNSLIMDNTFKKYEIWHFNWTKMLTDMF